MSYSLDESLGFWVYRVHTLSIAVLRKALQAKGFDVTPEQLSVMSRLGEHEGMNQSSLADKLLKDRHNMTRILDLLEKKGLIERVPHEVDRRAYQLYLTEAGRNTLKKVAPIVLEHWRKRVEGLPPEDLAAVRRILGHVSDNLENSLAKFY